ncbi:helix-turn-helix domain-containing protein [Psychrobacter lutiphocae]|uniref:helix-turn-helix domain-containing protein n=1 Tax=Psychrobacter lutiphocae TaxID=540500 RepID=UPI000685F27F|nr:helix-turn-helix domain-containing protein [Psychrobacter lutiphocae]
MRQPDPAVTTTSHTPLHQHVQLAVEQYFAELEGELPINLYQTILQEVEKPLLEVVLAQSEGNQSKAATILGLNRGTLRKKMQLYGLM